MASNYQMTYNFGEYHKSLEDYFSRLTQNSINAFASQINSGKILNGHDNINDPTLQKEFAKVQSFIKGVEEFLFYNYKHDRRNFKLVLDTIIGLKSITVLDDNQRGIYGITHSDGTIQINPNLNGNGLLDSDERTRLYVFHELGHMVNKKWMTSVTTFLSRQNNMSPREKTLFYEGFSLLDEATTQERAEQMAYFFAKKTRPDLYSVRDPRGMYGKMPYNTNFDFYGELQPPAIKFGRTLRGIGKIEDEQKVMRELAQRAKSKNFANDIIREYTRDGQLQNLFSQMHYMGLIKKASYARFGMGSIEYIQDSLKNYKEFSNIATRMRDYREPEDYDFV